MLFCMKGFFFLKLCTWRTKAVQSDWQLKGQKETKATFTLLRFCFRTETIPIQVSISAPFQKFSSSILMRLNRPIIWPFMHRGNACIDVNKKQRFSVFAFRNVQRGRSAIEKSKTRDFLNWTTSSLATPVFYHPCWINCWQSKLIDSYRLSFFSFRKRGYVIWALQSRERDVMTDKIKLMGSAAFPNVSILRVLKCWSSLEGRYKLSKICVF